MNNNCYLIHVKIYPIGNRECNFFRIALSYSQCNAVGSSNKKQQYLIS